MNKNKRCSGILMHISSLPNKEGIGTFGKEAFNFVDFLVETKQKIWQILPLGHTGYGDSPYQCYSAFAGNPLFINLKTLKEDGLLNQEDINNTPVFTENEFDTEKVSAYKLPLLRKAYHHFIQNAEAKMGFDSFCETSSFWLDDYALFMALKKHFNNQAWNTWAEDIKLRQENAIDYYKNLLHDEIAFYKTVQYFFHKQWLGLKTYANEKGISIFGDIPLYVSFDSSDAWANSEYFMFNRDKEPIAVAGVPPDYFSETGQLWGNPLYNWAKHAETNYAWWLKRIEANFQLYDILRIDHFRGLASYWAVPYGEETAIDGEWIDAPGYDLFKAIYNAFGDIHIIAEDLGVMTDDVVALRESYNLPGMKILQFAFNDTPDNEFLPHTYDKNCVVYTGTHDNDTTLGWYVQATEEEKIYLHDYLDFSSNDVAWALIKMAWASTANIAIAPMQDFLQLDTNARMNLPGKPTGYWQWRMQENAIDNNLIAFVNKITLTYNRTDDTDTDC